MRHDWPVDPGPHPPESWPVRPWTPDEPPPPFEPPPRSPVNWRIVALVASLALLAVTIGWFATRDDNEIAGPISVQPTTTQQPPGPSTTEPGSPPTTLPLPTEQLDDVLPELIAFVEQERGREFKTDPDVEVLDAATFQERLLQDFAEGEDDLVTAGRVFEALGLVEPGTDLVAAVRSLLGAGVVGFYDPTTEELVVRGESVTPYVKTVIVHELTHALDDQWFDLDRPELDERDDEASFGFTVLVEGTASTVEAAYRDSLSDEERLAATQEELSLGSQFNFGSVPPVLIEIVAAPYNFGPPLVEALEAEGGPDLVDESFADPPVSSEQSIHPDAFLAGDTPVPVATPPADGEAIDEGVLGELVVRLVLRSAVGTGDARIAATGWGGDRYVAWEGDGGPCIRAALEMDSEDDVAELRDSLQRWASQFGASVEAAGDLTTVTRCASGQASGA